MPEADEAVLIGRDAIAERVASLGARITEDLRPALAGARIGSRSAGQAERRAGGADDALIIIPVLTGALVFTADLIRRIPLRLSIRPVTLSSYRGGATTPGALAVHGDLPSDLAGRHVLIVDDILDTGRTLAFLRDAVVAQRPASVRICVLLRKEKVRERRVDADYVGFDIPDSFVVGYGLDYDGLERNRPDIMSLSVPGADKQKKGGGA